MLFVAASKSLQSLVFFTWRGLPCIEENLLLNYCTSLALLDWCLSSCLYFPPATSSSSQDCPLLSLLELLDLTRKLARYCMGVEHGYYLLISSPAASSRRACTLSTADSAVSMVISALTFDSDCTMLDTSPTSSMSLFIFSVFSAGGGLSIS